MPMPRFPNGLLRIHSDGHIKGGKYFPFIKGDKYFSFIKIDAGNVLLKLKCLYSRLDTIQKDHISHTKQCQTFIGRPSVTFKF